MVIASHRHRDNWNAIDPNLVVDHKGRPWLTFGSFWDGIQLIRLSKKDFQTPETRPTTIARRVGRRLTLTEIDDKTKFTIEGNDTVEAGENAIEAPFIHYRNGYYYLFVAYDALDVPYNTRVCRSKDINGPYIGIDGTDLTANGGNMLPVVTHPYKFNNSDG